jgi:uncharacterized protein (DUF983 family)
MIQGENRKFWLPIRRSLRDRCSNCGNARLFRAYLKQVDNCASCGEAWSEIRSDDAAPWLTILIVGHLMAPVMILMIKHQYFEPWVSAAILSPIIVGLSLVILPFAKGVFMAAIWALRANSS